MLSLLTLLTMLKQWHIHLDTLLYGRGTMEIGHGYMVLSPSEKKWTRLDTPLTAMTTIAPMLLMPLHCRISVFLEHMLTSNSKAAYVSLPVTLLSPLGLDGGVVVD